jgi:hypothetical protein
MIEAAQRQANWSLTQSRSSNTPLPWAYRDFQHIGGLYVYDHNGGTSAQNRQEDREVWTFGFTVKACRLDSTLRFLIDLAARLGAKYEKVEEIHNRDGTTTIQFTVRITKENPSGQKEAS